MLLSESMNARTITIIPMNYSCFFFFLQISLILSVVLNYNLSAQNFSLLGSILTTFLSQHAGETDICISWRLFLFPLCQIHLGVRHWKLCSQLHSKLGHRDCAVKLKTTKRYFAYCIILLKGS